mmetsp:Transcript_34360/g.113723  ORF Transcript_34360/g.113723 Transcript_34360/m.113723 type:complete len:133 (-) Transcript_34360:227-625(-)
MTTNRGRVCTAGPMQAEGRRVLRQILRRVPGADVQARRAARSHLLSIVRGTAARDAATLPASQATLPALGSELLFHLESQAELRQLNERYFPASELTDREKIARMARIVGLEAPEHADARDLKSSDPCDPAR